MPKKTYTQRQLDKAIRDSLTAYIVTAARQYSHGAWDGHSVACDMLQGAGIKPREIRRHEQDPFTRRKLLKLSRR